jgi:hypothetical protein
MIRVSGLATAIAVMLCTAAAAGGATQQAKVRVFHVTAHCNGDLITGKVTASGPSEKRFRLTVYRARTRSGSYHATKAHHRMVVRVTRRHAYRFSLNVSGVGGKWLRVVANHSKQGKGYTRSAPLLAATCAPGGQVPEAPASVLLPLSGAGSIALVLLAGFGWTRLRRRPA